MSHPFHEGEIAVQERAGERDIACRHSSIISSRIVPGALPFLAGQRLLAATTAGSDGHLWTSVWSGEPGFVRSDDGQLVTILPSLMAASSDDPVLRRLASGSPLGLLAIELTSRRRLRINGTIETITAAEIRVGVSQSVPNCPKYIQRRDARQASTTTPTRRSSQRGDRVDDERRAAVERADTAFVGSVHPQRGVDASHRGGPPGFIRIVDTTTLRIPDYPGNGMFMTLGNFEIDSRASLAVLDFAQRSVISFSGSARLDFGVEDPQHPAGGTGRYWDFTIREWVQFELAPNLAWELRDYSPFNPAVSRK